MARPKTKYTEDEGELALLTVRLKPATIAVIKQRAEADRRSPSQWLRILIEDALKAPKAVVK